MNIKISNGMKNFKKISGGFMMIEVLVSASIIAVSILAVMSVAQKSILVSSQALHTSQAASLLEEGAEAVRILRDNEWSNISSLSVATDYYPVFSAGTWSLSPTSSTVGIFTRTVTIANVNRDAGTSDIAPAGIDDPGTKLVTVTVSWVEREKIISKSLSFYILDIFSS